MDSADNYTPEQLERAWRNIRPSGPHLPLGKLAIHSTPSGNLISLFKTFQKSAMHKQQNHTIAEYCFDHNLRLEEMFHLGAATCNDSMPSALETIFEDEESLIKLLGLDEDIDVRDIPQALLRSNKLGFITRFATPVPTKFHKGGGWSCSWGYIVVEWFYGDNFAACFTQAQRWAEAYLEKRKAKARKPETRA